MNGKKRVVFPIFVVKKGKRHHRVTFLIKQKSPGLSVETTVFFISTIMKRWFRSCDLHARSFTNSFVCNFLSSSAGINLCRCFSRLTLAFRFRLRLSLGFHFHGLSPLPLLFLTSAVFAPLSAASVLDSDYSASVSSFPFLPASASQWLPQCSALPFVPAVFPVLSCLVSRAFFPGSGTQPRCMFPFALPRFAPTAVPQVLTFRSRFRYFPFRFRSLSVSSASLSATQPSASSFLPSVRSASQLASRPGSGSFRPRHFSPSSTSGFPSASFRFRLLSFLFVSFRPSLLRSHSRSTGASLSGFPSGINA